MIRRSLKVVCTLILLGAVSEGYAQGTVYTVLGGITLSTQTVNGFEKDPFFRFHGMVVMESSSEISPNSLYGALGYHIKGSAVNSPAYHDPVSGINQEQSSSSIEFHNLSASVGVKQRREVGPNFLSYGLGVRLDYNLKTDYGYLFAGLEGTENKLTYGLDLNVGFEFPISEFVSSTVEFGFSPDLKEQIYIPYQDTGYTYSDGTPVVIQQSYITNIVLEARVGFRFWRKVIYTD